jgi:hypothetical protein
MSSRKKQPAPAPRRAQGRPSAQGRTSPIRSSDYDLEAMHRSLRQKYGFPTPLPDEVVGYDKDWLKEVNAQRKAAGLAPLRQHKRNAVERERLRAMRTVVSPMMAADINPDYQLIPEKPATRQPQRERARRALSALYGKKVPDPAALPNKHLEKQINDWLREHRQPPISGRTIRRAAGRT